MFQVWRISRSGDEWIGAADTERKARRMARESVGHTIVFATDDSSAWGMWGTEIVAEFADFPGCCHIGEDEDEVVHSGGKCPACGLDWLVKASRIEI